MSDTLEDDKSLAATLQSGKESADGEVQMTNKQRRLARKAEKEEERKRKSEQGNEDGQARAAEGEQTAEQDVEGAHQEEEEEEEVEAVSHKEMRKRRKLEKQQQNRVNTIAEAEENGAGEPSTAGSSRKEGRKDSEQRSAFSLWIGNLSFQTAPQRLQDWLEEREIEGITRVHMPKGARRMEYNRGFAYVDVPTLDMMRKGIELSEGHLDGRRLLIKSGSDFAGRPSIDAAAKALAEGSLDADAADSNEENGEASTPEGRKGKTGLTKTAQKILRAQKHAPGPTLFFGNLSFSATEEGVREMIERAAAMRSEHTADAVAASAVAADERREDATQQVKTSSSALRGAGIRKIRMGTFEDTGKCKGFGFVDFHSATHATATLIDARNHHLDGRALIVQYAGADAIRRGAVKGKGGFPSDSRRPNDRARPFKRPRNEDEAGEEEHGHAAASLAETAPIPGSFDPDAPLVKKHKETKEEREERRNKRREENDNRPARRVKPGAALAKAQRGKTAIATDAPQVQKITFDNGM